MSILQDVPRATPLARMGRWIGSGNGFPRARCARKGRRAGKKEETAGSPWDESLVDLIIRPYCEKTEWSDLQASWDGMVKAFLPFVPKIIRFMKEKMLPEGRSPFPLETVSQDFLTLITNGLDEALSESLEFAFRVAGAGDKIVAGDPKRFMEGIVANPVEMEILENSVSAFVLAVLLMGVCADGRMQNGKFTEDQIDFPIIMAKENATVYYSSVCRSMGR